MKKLTILALIVFALLGAKVQPAYGVNRETIQMMQQLDQLQQAVQNLQKTVDTQTAVLKTLIEQANDNVNTMKVTINDLRGTMQQNLASTNARFDSLTSQIQALSESLEEAKARLAKLSDQMTQTQNILQTLPLTGAPQPGTNPTSPTGATKPGTVPDADSLYNSGLSYYNGGQYQLSIQSFQDYLKYYGDSDRASNAQFYIGDCYYSQGTYTQAIDEYNKCIERYPTGNKLAAAQLKKGYALLALEQKSAGVKELRSLTQRFPDSREADLARERLKKLGISSVPPHRKSN
ncbi:MAG: tetratricopeptide repeat protein [Acidobacteriia bacterium]|nr:tetratricopeptide repeat protein [Terriglobia bacterium]